ncbi:unnamed protein product [Colias eurytheme]|nr:unnamed protein product [Colias eurytheme]
MNNINNKKFVLGLLNVQSLHTGCDELQVTMEKYAPDVLALNETWTKAGMEKLSPAMPGYKFINNPRPHGARGGGVGFYVSERLRMRIRPHPHSELEQMWIELTLSHVGQIAVGTAYRPETTKVGVAIDALSESISAFGYCRHIFILTDFNINMLKLDKNPASEFRSFLSQQNLHQLVKEPTRIHKSSQTLLDLFITDSPEICENIKVVHNPSLSDHGLVVYPDVFDQDLKALPWNKVQLETNINEMANNFNHLLKSLFDKYAPLRKFQINNTPRPWITGTIKTMMDLRNKALEKAQRKKNDPCYRYYKDLKNFVTSAIKREKTAFFTHYINNNIDKPSIMWKYLRKISIAGNTASTYNIPQHLNDANKIQDSFIRIEGYSSADRNLINYFNNSGCCSHREFNIQTCEIDEVRKIINGISTNAAGHDTLTIEMIRMTLSVTLPIITSMINMSISEGIFPDCWKVAKITPLPKKDNVNDFKDLRAISILPVISKIIERIVYKQLTKFIEKENVLPLVQSGFRKGHGTATALAQVTDIISNSDEGNGSLLVLLDFTRAFDCIDVEMMVAKLKFYGVSSKACKWFRSYLMYRKQYVVVQNGNCTERSTDRTLSRGCPQGSILSPLLFSIYTADLVKKIKHGKVHLYADDTQIYYPINTIDPKCLELQVNNDLEIVNLWAKRNALLLNLSKTKFMILGTKTQCQKIKKQNLKIGLGNIQIARVDSARNLGVLLDEELRYEEHINLLVIKTGKPVYLYEKLSWAKDSHALNTRSKADNKLIIPKHKTKDPDVIEDIEEIGAAKENNDEERLNIQEGRTEHNLKVDEKFNTYNDIITWLQKNYLTIFLKLGECL